MSSPGGWAGLITAKVVAESSLRKIRGEKDRILECKFVRLDKYSKYCVTHGAQETLH